MSHYREISLTPDGQEAQRKKEERKNRLHQNYLRRKANGKEKENEDKIKAARKAEMEAKKAAIGSEDIGRGIFIPAGNLPKQEPKKATLTTRTAG